MGKESDRCGKTPTALAIWVDVDRTQYKCLFLLQSCKCNNFLRPGSLSTFLRCFCTLSNCAFFKL